MFEVLEKILNYIIVISATIWLTLTAVENGALRDDAFLHMSTVRWGEVEASVPEPIMREMGLKTGQEIDDERYFKLEAKR